LQDNGVTSFKQAVSNRLVSSLNDLKNLVEQFDVPLSRLFSLRQEFFTEWNRLLFPGDGKAQLVTESHQVVFSEMVGLPVAGCLSQPIILTIESVGVYPNPALDQSVDAAGVTFTINARRQPIATRPV
jgi:hypothetical protein